MDKIYISGGAGFIGLHLARRLLENTQSEVLIYDNLHSQVHGENVEFQFEHPRLKFIFGDVNNSKKFQESILQFNPDYIYHLVAETGTGQSQDEISRYTETNVQATASLVEAINQLQDFRKLILPSSRAIYGEGAYVDKSGNVLVGCARDWEKIKALDFAIYNENNEELEPTLTAETLRPSPESIYASTKLMQEYICKQARGDRYWDLVVFRLQNVYGPGQSLSNPYTGVLSIFSSIILDGLELDIYEDGNIVRDFIYIDDVVDALELAIQVDIPHGEVMNIGSGIPVKILDAAKILLREYGCSPDKYYISGKCRIGDIRYACADITKAKKQLGWKPRTTIDSGLAKLANSVKMDKK